MNAKLNKEEGGKQLIYPNSMPYVCNRKTNKIFAWFQFVISR